LDPIPIGFIFSAERGDFYAKNSMPLPPPYPYPSFPASMPILVEGAWLNK